MTNGEGSNHPPSLIGWALGLAVEASIAAFMFVPTGGVQLRRAFEVDWDD